MGSALRRSRRLRLGLALPATALLVPALVLTAVGLSLAGPRDLQQWFVLDGVPSTGSPPGTPEATVWVDALPQDVTLALRGVPPASGQTTYPTRYWIGVPGGPLTADVVPTTDNAPGDPVSYGSSAALALPAGTPCGTYPAGAVQNNGSSSSTAEGFVHVDGCPRQFEVAPLDEVRTGGPVPVTARGRYFPSHPDVATPPPAMRVLVDGEQLGEPIGQTRDTRPRTDFHRAGSLDLGCGPHVVEVQDASGGVLERRDLYLRCPTASLETDVVPRATAPRTLALDVAELASDDEYVVLLDGKPVGDGVTDAAGADRTSFTLPAAAPCGEHAVTVVQELADVDTVEPYPSREPTTDPGLPEGPPVISAFGTQIAAPGRTAVVTVPLTVACPGVPLLDVTPEVVVDAGHPVRYDVVGRGFADAAAVDVRAGDVSVPVPGSRADGIGGFTGTAELDLPCGPVTFRATDDRGRTASDVVQVRCPALLVDPPTVSAAELPGAVTAVATGFAGDVDVDVLLDGVDVGDARTDAAGRATAPVPLTDPADCGPQQVVVRQRAPVPPPSAAGSVTVVCPPPGTPVLAVEPDVVPTGYTARVTGTALQPGAVALVWRTTDGVERPAVVQQRPVVVQPDGTLRATVLVLRGDRLGPRQLLARPLVGPVVGDAEQTLVVGSPYQPGRRWSQTRVGLLARR